MAKITHENSNGKITLISHISGQGKLERHAGGGQKWSVRFCVVDADVPLLQGDDQALLVRAMKLGRPITAMESRALLLEKRLSGIPDRSAR